MLNKEDVYQSCAKSQASKSFNSNSRVHKLIQFKTASKIQNIFYLKVEDHLVHLKDSAIKCPGRNALFIRGLFIRGGGGAG